MADRTILFLIAGCLFGACTTGSNPAKRIVPIHDDLSVLGALPLKIPVPEDNPMNKEKAELGRLLFFDPILSGNKDVACATCHHPEYGFADNLDLSIGVNGKGLGQNRKFNQPNEIPFVKRNSQTVINSAFNGLTNEEAHIGSLAPMFWDLRVKGLENQSLEPIKAFEEMRGDAWDEGAAPDQVLNRLKRIAEYRRLFKVVFGGDNPITKENLAKAIATYERTIIGNNSRFDQYMRGNDSILSGNEILGMNLFLKDGCSKCHHGPMFSDFKTHVMGVQEQEKLKLPDDGYAKTYAFRTPSLRNLRFTVPYMHNGKLKTLENVLEFYEDLSGGKIANPGVKREHIDPLAANLKVDFKDISLIIEFLSTLNDDTFDRTIPTRVPSKLKVGGNID
jgi:cytochrome c peroxidase